MNPGPERDAFYRWQARLRNAFFLATLLFGWLCSRLPDQEPALALRACCAAAVLSALGTWVCATAIVLRRRG